MKATLLVIAMLGTTSPVLLAQGTVPGPDHVRLNPEWVDAGGHGLELPLDTLQLNTQPQLRPAAGGIPLRTVTEVRIRQDRSALQGAMRTGTVGLIIGGGIGVLAGLKVQAGECGRPQGAACVVNGAVKAVAPIFGGILGAGAGALIGGLIGSVRPGEQWVRISVPM